MTAADRIPDDPHPPGHDTQGKPTRTTTAILDVFYRWAERHAHIVFRRWRIVDANLRDDLLQITGIRLWETYSDTFPNDQHHEAPPELMARVLRNAIFENFKKDSKTPQSIAPNFLNEQIESASPVLEIIAEIREILAEHVKHRADFFEAYLTNDCNAQATANFLGITKRSVYRNLRDCIDVLRDMVRDGQLSLPPGF